ncbi:nucleotidyltransferase family protein [Methylocystis hirsuta]|nr:nucleotidyltransferase domain-containing protein [Methylocystis hirsuta]
MQRKELRTRLKSKAPDLSSLGVEGLFVFGSVLDERETADSDIDFVADFREGALGLTSFFELETLLRILFSRKIDLTTREALAPALKDRVTKSMVRVF